MTYEQKLSNILVVNNKLIKLKCKGPKDKSKISSIKESLHEEIKSALIIINKVVN